MRSFKIMTPAFAALSSMVSAQAREVRHLQPSSQWVVNYADDSCTLGRNFGEGPSRVTLSIEQLEPGNSFRMMFVGNSIRPHGRGVEPTVRFGPNEAESKETALAALSNNVPAIILEGQQRVVPLTEAEKSARKSNAEFDPPAISPERERASTWLELGKVLPFDLVLETGPMDAALAALRECSWDTVRTWGLDVEQQKRLARKARPTQPLYSWFSPDDYPTAMLRGGYQAIVNFRVLVDETGKVNSCHIQSSTRPKAFDDAVCNKVMAKAKFHPALDDQGKPVRSYWVQTVTFEIPQ